MSDNLTNSPVRRGDYPFPLLDGPDESPYLTWVRNHSNYMAVRGLLDYVRAAGVLLRGILVNFLVLLPYLLLAGLAVAIAHLFLPATFDFTEYTLIGALVCVLVFPLLSTLYRVAKHRARLKTGSNSSVESRDRYERLYGAILMAIVAVALFESLSVFLFPFHQLIYERELGWSLAAIGALAIVAFAGADKLLRALGGSAGKIALLGIGILGLFLPMLVILLVADFLVFSPPSADWNSWLLTLALVALALVVVTIILGAVTLSFTLKDLLKLVVLLAVCCGLFVTTVITHSIASTQKERFEETLHQSLYALAYPQDEHGQDAQEAGREQTHSLEKDVATFVEATVTNPGPKLKALNDYLFWLLSEPEQGYFDHSEESASGDDSTPDLWNVELPYYRSGLLQTLVELVRDVSATVNVEDLSELNEAIALADALDQTEFEDDVRQFALRFELEGLVSRLDSVRAVLLSSSLYMDELGADVQSVALDEAPSVPVGLILALFESAFASDGSSSLNQRAILDDYFDNVDRYLFQSHFDCFESPQEPACGHLAFPTQYPLLSEFASVRFIEVGLNDIETFVAEARSELSIAANYSRSLYPAMYATPDAQQAHITGLVVKGAYLLMFTALLWFLMWLTVDVNQTSIHGLYRDRLASAFLVGEDADGDIAIEKDLDLDEIACREAGSTAPYHLINVALNLQGSSDISIRDRKSDFFIFSKRFTGGQRTGYCRSESMNYVFPQMGLATAMAISAAAASPNMGRSTSPALVAIMTLLNVRLGYWIPNPGRLEQWLDKHKGEGDKKGAYDFDDVLREELADIESRWALYAHGAERRLAESDTGARYLTVANQLVGVGFSGGGIRSATINLGITQALNHRGVFDHIDYMSTVSGGGYLGSSLSALMRGRAPTACTFDGRVSVRETDDGHMEISIVPQQGDEVSYRFSANAKTAVKDGERVKRGYRLINIGPPPNKEQSSLNTLFSWRVRPRALMRELLGKLNETHRWVNVSDGGHIENLAGIELLRRRCKYIILGDGEADPHHHFNGLATLIRLARIDLGVSIDIDLKPLRLDENGHAQAHWAIGTIRYPGESEKGLLLYLKSSLTGDEDEVIREYKHAHSSFPHQSTADQFFGEGQFEAYRSLGQHIAEQALAHLDNATQDDGSLTFAQFDAWFETLQSAHGETGTET